MNPKLLQPHNSPEKLAKVGVSNVGVEPKIGGTVPQNEWSISWKHLLKWMIWGVNNPYFWFNPPCESEAPSEKAHPEACVISMVMRAKPNVFVSLAA